MRFLEEDNVTKKAVKSDNDNGDGDNDGVYDEDGDDKIVFKNKRPLDVLVEVSESQSLSQTQQLKVEKEFAIHLAEMKANDGKNDIGKERNGKGFVGQDIVVKSDDFSSFSIFQFLFLFFFFFSLFPFFLLLFLGEFGSGGYNGGNNNSVTIFLTLVQKEFEALQL